MKKNIILISICILFSFILFFYFNNNQQIMIIGRTINPTTIEYSKEINDKEIIEKIKKIFNESIIENDNENLLLIDEQPTVILKIIEKDITYIFEIYNKQENSILTINNKGTIKKYNLNSSKIQKVLKEIKQIEIYF